MGTIVKRKQKLDSSTTDVNFMSFFKSPYQDTLHASRKGLYVQSENSLKYLIWNSCAR